MGQLIQSIYPLDRSSSSNREIITKIQKSLGYIMWLCTQKFQLHDAIVPTHSHIMLLCIHKSCSHYDPVYPHLVTWWYYVTTISVTQCNLYTQFLITLKLCTLNFWSLWPWGDNTQKLWEYSHNNATNNSTPFWHLGGERVYFSKYCARMPFVLYKDMHIFT
jgi:hypothetical protein